ncbi:MAG: ectoine hydroxylase-related dioxygenase (phytanoyl-CoA dioxygenase family) [Gammaproteobacteria bacterium]|jgi:ectoine hydroxylase-related dioxygenase (phytanoyl-CoA dioxygenase family)
MSAAAPTSGEALADAYERDGFVFPYSVVSKSEAETIRADLEAGEAALADNPSDLQLLRSYPDRLLPSFDGLIRNPRLLDAASQILGPDLLVWGAGLFIKEANTPNYVSWHQDLNYWGLSDNQKVTAWVALSPSNVASGCMRFVPGSHKKRLVKHVDTFADQNLLSRGQEIAVEVDETSAAEVVLDTGEASLHHGHLFHASGPNATNDRRIGVAIRYIAPSMKQESGDRSLVALVKGEDRFGHFRIEPPPVGKLLAADFELCRQDNEIKRRVLYEGAKEQGGKRYR